MKACDNAKRDGIEIYTIGYKTDEDADVYFPQCASHEDNFLKGYNSDDLIGVFQSIASKIGYATPRLVY